MMTGLLMMVVGMRVREVTLALRVACKLPTAAYPWFVLTTSLVRKWPAWYGGSPLLTEHWRCHCRAAAHLRCQLESNICQRKSGDRVE